MHISFGTSRRRKQWPITRTKEAPRFERISQARQWLEEQEENRLQGEKIERPNTKWRFEKNLMVEVKIVEDPQSTFACWSGALARLASKQKRFVGSC